MNRIDDLVRLTRERSVKRAPDALRIGRIENGLPARGSAADGAVDVVEEAAAPGAAALVRGHGGVWMWPVAPLETHWLRRSAGTGLESWGAGAARVVAARAATRRLEDLVMMEYIVGATLSDDVEMVSYRLYRS